MILLLPKNGGLFFLWKAETQAGWTLGISVQALPAPLSFRDSGHTLAVLSEVLCRMAFTLMRHRACAITLNFLSGLLLTTVIVLTLNVADMTYPKAYEWSYTRRPEVLCIRSWNYTTYPMCVSGIELHSFYQQKRLLTNLFNSIYSRFL